MRANPGLDIEAAITELAVGEALISFLDKKGRPSITERVFVMPPGSQIGPIIDEQRKRLMAGSLVAGVYEKTVDRESAYEKLQGRATTAPPVTGGMAGVPPGTGGATAPAGSGMFDGWKDVLLGSTGPRGGKREGLAETMAKSVIRTMGSTVGREIIRGVFGTMLGGSKRR